MSEGLRLAFFVKIPVVRSGSDFLKIIGVDVLVHQLTEARVFDTSFSLCLPQIPYLSHLGFLFFVKFYDFIRAILCYLWY
ncbi:MAG: hypothetical protein LKI35_02390, partial [Lachnospiraceae bacterium]|nr:hypothetical protein [Lachnospiraceae bacterium]